MHHELKRPWHTLLAPALLAGLMATTFAATQRCDSSGSSNTNPCDGVNCNEMCNAGARRCSLDRLSECQPSGCCGYWLEIEDCAAGGLACSQGACVTYDTLCSNGARDPQETDLDCGGSLCPPCADGRHCVDDSDCASDFCTPEYTCDATP